MAPPYVRFIRRLPIVGGYQPATFYLISSVGLTALYFALAFLTGHSSSRNELVAMFFSVGLISAGGVLLANGYVVVRSALAVMPSMFKSDQQRELLKQHMQIMLVSPYQYLVAFGFAVLGAILVWRLDAGIPGILNALFIAYSFLAFLMMGFGLWLAIATLHWISVFPAYGPFRLFAIPSRTVALRQASKVTGIFALSFSLETGLAILALLSVDWANPGFFHRLTPLLVLPFSVLCVIFFVYPQLALMKIINAEKLEIARDLERLMQGLDVRSLDGGAEDAKFKKFEKIVELHQKVSDSPSTSLDLATISKFLTSLLVPLTIFIKDSRLFEEALQFIWEMVR